MAKKYVVVDNHGNALGMYVCTVSEAETIKDVRLVALSEYVEFRRNALKGGKDMMIGRKKSNCRNLEMMCHAIKPANGWEYALFYNRVEECYELHYSMVPNGGTFRQIMKIDNLADANREYNIHVA